MTYQPNPFARLRMYTRPTEGGVSVDTKVMLGDIIMIFKAGGLPVEALHQAVNETWPEVEVQIEIPNEAKQ